MVGWDTGWGWCGATRHPAVAPSRHRDSSISRKAAPSRRKNEDRDVSADDEEARSRPVRLAVRAGPGGGPAHRFAPGGRTGRERIGTRHPARPSCAASSSARGKVVAK